jgi:F-type H+-transporting ATPase subunit gamma
MASLRELKRRIKSVDGIRQITRAMEMVAATKPRRAQQRIEAGRPYTGKMDQILSHLSAAIKAGIAYHPLLEPREEVTNVLVIAVASSKGLCGSFNSNIIRATEKHARGIIDSGKEVSLFLIGRKIYDFFNKRGWPIHDRAAEYINIDENLPISVLQDITSICTSAFLAGRIDRVDLIYTEFKSAISHKVVQHQFLPIIGLEPPEEDEAEEREEAANDYIFEPEPEKLFTILIPKYARMVIFRMLADSLASEHGGRMNAMHNATDNAVDMIRTLTLQRNKARQAAITKELSEIVGGAEAIKG